MIVIVGFTRGHFLVNVLAKSSPHHIFSQPCNLYTFKSVPLEDHTHTVNVSCIKLFKMSWPLCEWELTVLRSSRVEGHRCLCFYIGFLCDLALTFRVDGSRGQEGCPAYVMRDLGRTGK